jgi:hypothetical protein
MTNELNKVFDRIKKLLRLSESDNVHEAEIALQRANELMKEYSIAQKDVADSPESDKAKHEVVSLNTSSEWALLLAWYICGAFGVHAISTGTKQVRRGRKNNFRATQEMYMFGTDARIKTTKLMIDFAIDTVKRLTKLERKRIRNEGQQYSSYGTKISTRSYMSSWRKGVVNGMGITLKAIKEQNRNKNAKDKRDRQYAMVLLSEIDKAKAIAQVMFPRTATHRAKQRGDSGIFANGSSEGQKVGFNKQAGAGKPAGFLK